MRLEEHWHVGRGTCIHATTLGEKTILTLHCVGPIQHNVHSIVLSPPTQHHLILMNKQMQSMFLLGIIGLMISEFTF